MSRPVHDYLPSALHEVLEFKAITAFGEQPEIDGLYAEAEKAIENQFVATADADSLRRLEKILGISSHASSTLEERRFAVSAQLLNRLPTTYRFLQRQLETLCGADGYTMQLNAAQYKLTVRLALAAKGNYQAVKNQIEQIKPANILLDLDLLYNRNNAYEGMTYAQLAAFTHNILRSEVINGE